MIRAKLVKVASFSISLLVLSFYSVALGLFSWYLPLTDDRQRRLAMAVGVGGVFWLREFFYVLLKRAQ